MRVRTIIRRRWLFSAALAVAVSATASAQTRVTLPAGTVIIVRTTSPFQSASAQTGQRFETTVDESVGVNEYNVIPAGSTIAGSVTVATRATRQRSGVIELVFDRLTLPNGTTYPISAHLTSTDSAERRQIESDPNARVVLVGGRGGIGAEIAGAGSSAGTNNILGALGTLLSQGRDVDVPAGTQLAVQLDQTVTLRTGSRLGAGIQGSTIYTSSSTVIAAQQALSRLNYYRGPINGTLDNTTRRALFAFQIDRGLNGTGNLDGRTAQALGINIGGSGYASGQLSPSDLSVIASNARTLADQQRSELATSSIGRVNRSGAYGQGDYDLWFALSAFADNASQYQQLLQNGTNQYGVNQNAVNQNAVVLAGRSLAGAARRVDTALQNSRASVQVQNSWRSIRRQIATLDTSY